MKKIFSSVFAVVLVAGLCPGIAMADSSDKAISDAAATAADDVVQAFDSSDLDSGTDPDDDPDPDDEIWFADVTGPSDWYYNAVYGMAERGYVTGYYDDYYGDGSQVLIFNHGGVMDRAQLATVLWRMAGEPEVAGGYVFYDVDYSAYYGDAVRWAYTENVITGYRNDEGRLIFDPSGGLDFEAMVTMTARAAIGYDKAESWPQNTLGARFADADEVSDWARGPVAWAAYMGLVLGSGEGSGPYYIDPGDQTARGRAVTVLWRAYEAGMIPA